MPDLQPLNSEDDILKEAHAVAEPQARTTETSYPEPDEAEIATPEATAHTDSYSRTATSATRPSPALVPIPVAQDVVVQEIDRKPFHYKLPVQNYVISTILLGVSSLWILYLVQAAIVMANAKSLMRGYGGSALVREPTISIDTVFYYVPLVVFVVLGLSLLSNRKWARTVALVAALAGMIYWGYFLIQFGQIGLAILSLFGLYSLFTLVIVFLPLGLIIYTFVHLLRPKVAAAYRSYL